MRAFRAGSVVVLVIAILLIKSKVVWLYMNVGSGIIAAISTVLLGKAHETFIKISVGRSLLRYWYINDSVHQSARVLFAEIINKKREHLDKNGEEPTFFSVSIFKDTLKDGVSWLFLGGILFTFFTTAHLRESYQINTLTLAARFFMIFIGLYLYAKYRFLLKQEEQSTELIVYNPGEKSDSHWFLSSDEVEESGFDPKQKLFVRLTARKADDGVLTKNYTTKFFQ